MVPQTESGNAVGSFRKLVVDRKVVQDKLNRIHRAKADKFRKAHPPHVYVFGERVWYRDYRCKKITDKLGGPPRRTYCANRVKNTWIGPKTCFTYLGWSF